MIQASDMIAAHESEAQFHAAMGTAILPDVSLARSIPPNDDFPV
jgi:hypothetical protein